MIAYTHEGGYGNADVADARAAIDRACPPGCPDRATLRELLYDYECLRRVVEGGGFVFRHRDGSEVRRVKLYD